MKNLFLVVLDRLLVFHFFFSFAIANVVVNQLATATAGAAAIATAAMATNNNIYNKQAPLSKLLYFCS